MNSGKLLIISARWPEPSTTAAGVRMMQLIRCFRDRRYQICYACTGEKTIYSENLEAHGVQTQQALLNDQSFDEWMAEWKPDMVLFDRFMLEEQFGWRVALVCPNALRILDSEDLHSLRLSRKEALEAGLEFSPGAWLEHPYTLRELASIYRSDISLVISRKEMEILRKSAGISKQLLYYLPFMFDPVRVNLIPPFEEREGYICAGNGRHQPNVDAIQWLREDLWPRIRAIMSDARLDVYGAYMPSKITQLHDPGIGFHIRGWTEDLDRKLLEARVQLAPLRYGAGIKGKLADSMRCGTPSVTTPFGAEGMHGEYPWNGFIAKDATSFIDSAILLYQNREEWNLASSRGQILIEKHFSRDSHQTAFLEKINWLNENLKAHRKQNIIGSMMNHHRMASTKYLGKWIEVKRKLADKRGE